MADGKCQMFWMNRDAINRISTRFLFTFDFWVKTHVTRCVPSRPGCVLLKCSHTKCFVLSDYFAFLSNFTCKTINHDQKIKHSTSRYRYCYTTTWYGSTRLTTIDNRETLLSSGSHSTKRLTQRFLSRCFDGSARPPHGAGIANQQQHYGKAAAENCKLPLGRVSDGASAGCKPYRPWHF